MGEKSTINPRRICLPAGKFTAKSKLERTIPYLWTTEEYFIKQTPRFPKLGVLSM